MLSSVEKKMNGNMADGDKVSYSLILETQFSVWSAKARWVRDRTRFREKFSLPAKKLVERGTTFEKIGRFLIVHW